MKSSPVCIILAGGSGTRFWPLSTPERPKQFLTLHGDRSMIQQTYDRVLKFTTPGKVYVVTSEEHVATVKEHLPELNPINILGEPAPKDTAAAVALGLYAALQQSSDEPVVILPADHLILDQEGFTADIHRAISSLQHKEGPCALGIKPTFPATGYGYIESSVADGDVLSVKSFREKPCLEDAEAMIKSESFLWNAGVYIWNLKSFWNAIENRLPEHASAIASSFGKDLKSAYEKLKRISIDVSVIEKTQPMWVVPARFDWKDIGSWQAVEDLCPKWPGHNRGRYTFKHGASSRNFVFCESPDEDVMLIGVHDLVIVRSGNRTLIAHRDKLDELKGFVEKVKYWEDVDAGRTPTTDWRPVQPKKP